MHTVESVEITRPSIIDGGFRTRRVYIAREWDSYCGIELGRPVIVTNQPGHAYEIPMVLSPSEQARIERVAV